MSRIPFRALFSTMLICVLPFGCKCNCKKERDLKATHQAYINEQIALANKHIEQQEIDKAILLLENLSHRFPYEPTIWEMLGVSYSTAKKNALAATTFERVAYMGVEFQENALYAAQAYKDIEDWSSASRCYRFYLDGFPKDSNAWKELSMAERMQGHTFLALQSYLKSLDVTSKNLSEKDAITLGELFLEVKNLVQADFWLRYVIEKTPDSLDAHLGLLRLAYEQKLWVDVAKEIAIIEKTDIEAIRRSNLEFIRNDLANHLALQKEANESNAKASEAHNNMEEAVSSQVVDLLVDYDFEKDFWLNHFREVISKITLNNTNLIASFEDPEALNKYLTEGAYLQERLNLTNNFGLKNLKTDMEVLQILANQNNEIAAQESQKEEDAGQPNEAEQPLNIVELSSTVSYNLFLKQGHEALLKGDVKEAIKSYQMAVVQDIKPSEAWYALAQAFFINKEWSKAELAILEALEREPRNITFELHFLRIAQKKYSSTQFMDLLKKAYENFPSSPEITLILGRAYERIGQNRVNAITAYQKFLELAPSSHPKRQEVQNSLARLMPKRDE